MTGDVQLPDPPARLLEAAVDAAPGWLLRVTAAAATRGGRPELADDPDVRSAVDRAVEHLVTRLTELMHTDVDEQRTTPLSVFRAAVDGPAGVLSERGVAPSPAPTSVPGDEYGLAPATWADIDETLHDPGIAWGAWKAMTVLARRRDDGLR